jgi:hypothetical protein
MRFITWLRCVRSDQGDGGWSIHHSDATDDEIANGEGRGVVLHSGTAEWIEDEQIWNRPNDQDYIEAAKRAKNATD